MNKENENENAFLFSIVVIFALAIAIIGIFCGEEMVKDWRKVILSGIIVFVIIGLIYVLFCIILNWNKPKIGKKIIYENTLIIPLGTTVYERNSDDAEVEKIIFIDKKTKLEDGCFWGYSKLKTVDFPSELKEIPAYAFAGCKSIENVELPTSVKKIDKFAFYECVGLKTINIQNIKEIGDHAFEDNFLLETVKFEGSIKSISASAFKNCDKLLNIEFNINFNKFDLKTIENKFLDECNFSFNESDKKNKTYTELLKLKQKDQNK